MIGKILYMQAIGKGPYQEALEKRGAGLHHIAINVENTIEYMKMIKGSGWYIHSQSLELFDSSKSIFLSRPGVPLLIEVQEVALTNAHASFVSKVEISDPGAELVNQLLCESIAFEPNGSGTLQIDGSHHDLHSFF